MKRWTKVSGIGSTALLTSLLCLAGWTGASAIDLSLGGPPQEDDGSDLLRCVVKAKQEVDVPARQTGQIVSIGVVDGQAVSVGEAIAQIDDRQARIGKFAAETRLSASLKEANNENAILEAEAALRLAQKDLERKLTLFNSNTISEAEYERAVLAEEHAQLALQNRIYEKEIAAMKAAVDEEAVKSAEDEIERHQIVSPIQGNVFQIERELGEWVNVGDPVAKVTRMDVLRIEGQIDGERFNPEEIMGRPVTVRTWRARGEYVDFHGQIVHVGLRQTSGKRYQFRAEVENRQHNGHWLLTPGAQAVMTIHME